MRALTPTLAVQSEADRKRRILAAASRQLGKDLPVFSQMRDLPKWPAC